jgi:serine/threonine-protein kinase
MATGSLTGKLLADRFIMKDLLGSGGMGDVYLATHDVLGVDYAVKLLLPELLSDPSMAERFKREAYAASKLRHPGIVQIIDFGADEDGLVYLVMEHVAGQSLAQVIQQHAPDPVPLTRALGLMAQIAAAVQSAHDAGVVHRDLKPDNIRIASGRDGEDVVKILDFGLAKLSSADGGESLTAMGSVFGTPLYMSPEQTQGWPVDHRSDVYALGVLAYELACGRPPFVFDSIPLLFMAHQNERPAPPSVHLPIEAGALPSALEDVILQCLEKDPAARPPRAAVLQEVCRQVLAGLQTPPGRPRAVPEDLGKVIRDPASGSDWTRMASSFSPFQHGPTIRGAQLVQDGPVQRLLSDPAYRQWYWGQAVKMAESLAQRLLADGIGGEPLTGLLRALREAEDRTVALETDLTILGVRGSEAEAGFHAEEARIRDAVVEERHVSGSRAGPLSALEQELAAFYRTRQERRAAHEDAYAAGQAALVAGQQAQATLEAQLFGLLHQLRPEPCPYGLRREYEGVAAMLVALS